uniref:Importin N-terminal domain-containing protein n=1 Tax=Steinernema glaseri TaxID=37863 RepID=A0A1I7ZA47_9BILA
MSRLGPSLSARTRLPDCPRIAKSPMVTSAFPCLAPTTVEIPSVCSPGAARSAASKSPKSPNATACRAHLNVQISVRVLRTFSRSNPRFSDSGTASSTMADLAQVLEKTISQNPSDQQLALDFLKQAGETNFPEFVRQLSLCLRANAVDFIRQAAGLQLKNALVAKEDATKQQYTARWLQLAEEVRQYVKENVMATIGTERFRPSIAAQCIAAIACTEIPNNLWPTVIDELMQNVTDAQRHANLDPESSVLLKEASLEALGYICQDLFAGAIESQSNSILNAIVRGMGKEETSNRVRLAATNAMLNSLEFTRTNFSNEMERHLIMRVVCEATQCNDGPVKVAAMQCLVRIMSLYYQYMEYYMAQALFPITLEAMKSGVDDFVLQGIEFWSNVCEEELTLNMEAEEAQEQGRTPEHVSRHYAKGALPHLIPMLTETLAHQEHADDDDDWIPSKAAGVCIMLLAQCTGDDIIGPILPFITQHFTNADWKYREAAIMAFGSIMEGPQKAKLLELVGQAIGPLITALSAPDLPVRDTAAWTIGRVCDACEELVTQPTILSPLLPALSNALTQEPRVAANVCWAISSLTKASYESACQQGTDDSGQPETYILSGVFEGMVNELLKTTDRQDAHHSNLRIAAYETLMELIKNSPKDCYPVVQRTTVTILRKLEQLLNMESSLESNSDKSQLRDLQSLLCATLQSVLRKMHQEDTIKVSDLIMRGLISIMQRCQGKDAGGVMEDALMAVSTLIEAMGSDFAKYMDAFRPFLLAGLEKVEETQVCSAAIGVITDLARAFEKNLLPLMDEIYRHLILVLQKCPDRSVQPQVLSCIGDLALAIGPEFKRFYPHAMPILVQAAQAAKISQNTEDYDLIDYIDDLRDGCLEGFTGIVQGLRCGPEEAQLLQNNVPEIIGFIHELATAVPEIRDATIAHAAGLLGDLLTTYGVMLMGLIDNEVFNGMLTKGRRSKSSKTKTLCSWVTKEMRKLKNN